MPTNKNNQSTSRKGKGRKARGTGFRTYRDGFTEMGDCAKQYALAIAEPFDPRAQGACIPRTPALPSQKITTFNRFPLVAGSTDTWLAVWVAPCLANDGYIAYYTAVPSGTTSGFTGGSNFVNAANITSGVVKTISPNSPYSMASMIPTGTASANVSGRVVATAISVEYTGTALNMGGTYLLYASPSHEDIGEFTSDTLLAQDTTIQKRVGPSKNWIGVSSIQNSEFEYPTNQTAAINCAFPYSSYQQAGSAGSPVVNAGAYPQGAPVMCIMIQVPAASTGSTAASFNIQIVQHVEFVGRSTAALHSPTHSDMLGFEKVSSAASQVNARRAQYPNENFFSALKKEINMAAVNMAPGIAHRLTQYGARSIMGGIGRLAIM